MGKNTGDGAPGNLCGELAWKGRPGSVRTARIGGLQPPHLILGQPEPAAADHELADEVVLRGEALVTVLARADDVLHLGASARHDLCPTRRDGELKELPAVALRIEAATALDHRLERKELDDRPDGI